MEKKFVVAKCNCFVPGDSILKCMCIDSLAVFSNMESVKEYTKDRGGSFTIHKMDIGESSKIPHKPIFDRLIKFLAILKIFDLKLYMKSGRLFVEDSYSGVKIEVPFINMD